MLVVIIKGIVFVCSLAVLAWASCFSACDYHQVAKNYPFS